MSTRATMNMKNFVLATICTVFLTQVCAGWEPEDEICTKKLNIERSVIEPLTEKLIQEDVDNDNYNKYSQCYWQEKKMLNEDGSINWEQVVEQLGTTGIDRDQLKPVANECKEKNISGKDVGQTIVKNQNCIMKGIFKGLVV